VTKPIKLESDEVAKLKLKISHLEGQIAELKVNAGITEPRIKKLKLQRDDKGNDRIAITYQSLTPDGDWDNSSISRKAAARPQFYHALEDLAPYVCLICELDPDYKEEMSIIGVSFSYSDEDVPVMGATITAQKKLETATSPLILNTPHKSAQPYGGGEDDSNCFDEKTVQALNRVSEECQRYLRGERAQLSFL
jgi:hypothetical protein